MRVQYITSALLGYAAVITYKCPCTKTNSCHLPHYFASVGVASLLIAYENGLLRALPVL